ncbi:MAG: TlpA family protein disulfide reductase [Sinomicrobium sp.]|nr:TlpA family protein disulfide reductase [Sinomicrobium sp.]
MKINRRQGSNLIFLTVLALLLFTPAGTYVKVWVNRLLAFSPSVTAAENRTILKDYRWELRSPEGKRFDLTEAEGEVILINFWATWCPPCIAELPGLQKLYNDYKNKAVFIFVSDERSDVIKGFMAKNGYELPVFYPLGNAPEALVSKSIPATYVVDKKGAIVIAKTGAADWNSKKVRRLMDELLSE